MKLELKADRQTIVVGASLALLTLLVLWCVLYFWSLRQGFVQEIDYIQPRTARLLGILESSEELTIASGVASNMLQDIAYPAGRDSAMVAATMQQDIRERMTEAGLSVSGSQILATRRAEGVDRVSLDITVEGNIDALDEALTSLELMRPLVIIESVRVKPARSAGRGRNRGAEDEGAGGGDPRKLSARFQLFSLRLQG